MAHPRDYFSATYADARRRFTEAAKAAGFAPERHINSKVKGPAGEELSTEVVRIGPKDAENVIFVSSGTHGVEGFCGSGAQVGMLANGLHRELPKNTALVFIHAINPHGFAHERRVNEDNVDLNRNFRDHATKPPHNKAYAEVHDHLIPADWDGPARKAADAAIVKYIAERGERAFQAAVSTGQWEFPDGLFYGGKAPTWSNQLWRRLIREHARNARRIVHLDFHTGLGAYGDCEVIFGPNTVIPADLARARLVGQGHEHGRGGRIGFGAGAGRQSGRHSRGSAQGRGHRGGARIRRGAGARYAGRAARRSLALQQGQGRCILAARQGHQEADPQRILRRNR